MKQILLLGLVLTSLSACETVVHRDGGSGYEYDSVYLGPGPFVGPGIYVDEFGDHHHHGWHHHHHH